MSKPVPPCFAEHEAIKRDHARWSQLIFNGYMQTEDDDGNPALLELRTCQSCRSTLAVLVLMRDAEVAA